MPTRAKARASSQGSRSAGSSAAAMAAAGASNQGPLNISSTTAAAPSALATLPSRPRSQFLVHPSQREAKSEYMRSSSASSPSR